MSSRSTQIIYTMTEKRSRLWPRLVVVLAVLAMSSTQFAFDYSLFSAPMTKLMIATPTQLPATSLQPTMQRQQQQQRRYAYAFLLAACDPADRRYRGFLYNILLAIYSLQRTFQSHAEYVIMIQMAANSNYDELLPDDVEPFTKLNTTTIHFKYLPKPRVDTYYQSMLSKFLLLNYTDYSRILFLDADVLPLCNLDFMFDLSEQGVMKENFIMASRGTPANGGFFMLRPGPGEYSQLQAIIRRQQEGAMANAAAAKATGRRGKAFDYVEGWGHVIQAPDAWVTSRGKRNQQWNFYGSFADQGLLYHWVKYVKQNVSILLEDKLENWSSDSSSSSSQGTNSSNSSTIAITTGTPHLEWNVSTHSIPGFGCPGRLQIYPEHIPPLYKDYWHFTGDKKPWELTEIPKDSIESANQATTANDLWFYVLRQVNDELDLKWNITKMIPLGAAKLNRVHKMNHIIIAAQANDMQA